MRRRDFILGIGSVSVASPLAVHAQQLTMPVIGILATASPEANATRLRALREGLAATGYEPGRNVNIEYLWAEEDRGRIPELATRLLDHKVAVLVAAGTPAALAAKAATARTPIVFGIGNDPVGLGLVASLNRPGGNATGVTSVNVEIAPKRLELLREVLPSATNVAFLVNATSPLTEMMVRTSQAAADANGMRLLVLHASNERDFSGVFQTMIEQHVGALVIAPDNFFTGHIKQLAELTVRHALPAIYEFRRFAAAGGLMSYGASETEYYRLIGNYVGRILKGDKPADLPVQQATKVELTINLKTAKALGISIPLPILGRADEVIE
jgi:putative tryptophan/tyrosine transport system substrate-binding protein